MALSFFELMGAEYHRVLLLFVDGLGLAPAGPRNALSEANTPVLASLLGGPLVLESTVRRSDLVLAPIDACLGVEGLPQSATGQTALFTGVNGARELGRHVTGFPGPRLRAMVSEHGIFGRAVAAGLAVTFANAYSREYLEAYERGARRPSVTTCALAASGLPFRTFEDLERGRAVSWDITRERFAGAGGFGPGGARVVIEPEVAGRHLAALTGEHRLTVFETFLTDLAGHGRFGLSAAEALRRIDGLIAGYLEQAPSGATLILTSDHGNIEDSVSRSHTRNPVPLLAVGPLAPRLADLESILDVTPCILDCLTSGPALRRRNS